MTLGPDQLTGQRSESGLGPGQQNEYVSRDLFAFWGKHERPIPVPERIKEISDDGNFT